MFIRKMENFSLKVKKKIKNPIPITSIRDWLNDLSREHGQWQTILKFQMSPLKTDSFLST